MRRPPSIERLTERDKAEILAALRRHEKVVDVARRFGVSRRCIVKIRGPLGRMGRPTVLDEHQKRVIVRAMTEIRGATFADLVEVLGRHRLTVKAAWREAGGKPLRPGGGNYGMLNEARKIARRNRIRDMLQEVE